MGKTVYSSDGREAYVKQLPAGTSKAVMTLYALYDVDKEVSFWIVGAGAVMATFALGAEIQPG